MNKTRNSSIDAAAGVMIITMLLVHVVIFAHATDSNFYNTLLCIFGFYMQWFFFKAGMFFKPTTNFKVLIQKKQKRLIRPYIFMFICGQFFYSLSLLTQKDYKITHHILKPIEYTFTTGAPNSISPLWFLLTLFASTILLNYIITKKKWFLFAICVIIPFFINYTKPYYIANICSGIIFMFLGYKFKNIQYNKHIFIISITIYAILQSIYPSAIHMRANNVAIGSYILSYPAAILVIISINNIFKNIKYSFPILSLIGRNSMGIYLFHWIILTIVETLFTLFSIDNHQLYTAALIISNIILLPIIITLIRRSHYSDII